MSEQIAIPDNCWTCSYSYNCYSSFGEGTCKYKTAIEERERKNSLSKRKEGDSNRD